MAVGGMDRGACWSTCEQPAAHQVDLRLLRQRDALRDQPTSRTAPFFGASDVIASACAWWWIIPCMKRTSAVLYVGVSSETGVLRQRPARLAGCAGLDDVRRGLIVVVAAAGRERAKKDANCSENNSDGPRLVAA